MAKRRHTQLFELGVEAYCKSLDRGDGDPMVGPHALLRAFSVMLAEATKKPTRKNLSDDQEKLVLSPGTIYTAIKTKCKDKVACEPYDTRWFGRLGGVLRNIPDLHEDDLPRLISFINGGGISFWQTTFTFGHLIKWLPDMIAKARKEQGGTEAKNKQVRSAFS